MMARRRRPKIGLLGLTLELYETLAPPVRKERDAFVRRVLQPGLAKHADVLYDGAVFRREDIERTVADSNQRAATAQSAAVKKLAAEYRAAHAVAPAASRRVAVQPWRD